MTFEPFDDGTRLMEKGRCKVGALTIADQISKTPNPYLKAVACQIRRQLVDSPDHLTDKKIFYFSDGSALPFGVTYHTIEVFKE